MENLYIGDKPIRTKIKKSNLYEMTIYFTNGERDWHIGVLTHHIDDMFLTINVPSFQHRVIKTYQYKLENVAKITIEHKAPKIVEVKDGQ